MRILLATFVLLMVLPDAAHAADLLIDNAFHQGGGSHAGTITLVSVAPTPAMPKWGYVALAVALVVVGAVVMRRRAR
jgi:hypothetical protein